MWKNFVNKEKSENITVGRLDGLFIDYNISVKYDEFRPVLTICLENVGRMISMLWILYPYGSCGPWKYTLLIFK